MRRSTERATAAEPNLHAAPSLADLLPPAELQEIANGIGIPSGALDVSEWTELPD